jgi:hypothetical protein
MGGRGQSRRLSHIRPTALLCELFALPLAAVASVSICATTPTASQYSPQSATLKFALSIIAFVIGYPAFAFAQVTVDVSKITCKQFALHERHRDWWQSGLAVITPVSDNFRLLNIQALEKNRKEIERFCTKVDNLEVPLMQAVEKVLGPNQ